MLICYLNNWIGHWYTDEGHYDDVGHRDTINGQCYTLVAHWDIAGRRTLEHSRWTFGCNNRTKSSSGRSLLHSKRTLWYSWRTLLHSSKTLWYSWRTLFHSRGHRDTVWGHCFTITWHWDTLVVVLQVIPNLITTTWLTTFQPATMYPLTDQHQATQLY